MDPEGEFQSLVSQARIVFETGDFQGALDLCDLAYKIKPCPKLLRKIERIKQFMHENQREDVEYGASPVKEVVDHLLASSSREMKAGNLAASLNFLKEAYEQDPSEEMAAKISCAEKAIQETSDDAKKVDSTDSLTKSDELIEEARRLYHAREFKECLKALEKAQSLHYTDKVQRKIERITTFLNEEALEKAPTEPKVDLVSIDERFFVPRLLYEKLYPYQRDGVRWLWNLHNNGPGGVLADDMGLGKTVQVIAFLSGLFLSCKKTCAVLIVMPVSVLVTWETELKKWSPTLRVTVFHDSNRASRLRSLAVIQRRGGILLTTYGMITSSAAEFATDVNADPQFIHSVPKKTGERIGPEYHWTYVILDEAHRIKNPATKATKGVLSISAKHRILLTGTAVQNNLQELWSLYNCTHSGRLLGRMQTFKNEYEKPITRAREKDATRAERAHGQLMAQSLRKLIDPYFLRRTKAEVLRANRTEVDQLVEDISADVSKLEIGTLPKKTELVVWIYLRQIQEWTYRNFLESNEVKELLLLTDKRSALMQLIILKKLCDHPRLLSPDQCANLNLEVTKAPDGRYSKHYLPPAPRLADESGKLFFLSILLNSFLHEVISSNKHPPRTLIFSQSLRLLNMAEKVILDLNNRPENASKGLEHRVLRLDGSLAKVEERLEVIRLFERDKKYTVMLLTTQVGGVGLTLTSANRVIILDPSWNPATDAQAVDRAYRIGQKSDVIVYRLITCGTVEEKIYRRQIFKESIIRQTTTTGRNKADKDPFRYFSRQELRELFALTDCRVSETQQQLAKLHEATEKWADEEVAPHLHYLTGPEFKDVVFGLSFHDLMFSRAEAPLPEKHITPVEAAHEQEFLRNRLIAAEYAIARECADSGSNLPSTLVKPHLNQPAGGLFLIPSHADSRNPMLNRPGLGVHSVPHHPTHPPKFEIPNGPILTNSDIRSDIGKNTIEGEQLAPVSQQMSFSELRPPVSECSPAESSPAVQSSLIVISDGEEDKLDQSHSSDNSKYESSNGCAAKNLQAAGGDTEELAMSLHEMSISERHTPPSNQVDPSAIRGRDIENASRINPSPLPSHSAFLKFAMKCVHRSTPTSSASVPLQLRKSVLLSSPLQKPREPLRSLSPDIQRSAWGGHVHAVQQDGESGSDNENSKDLVHMDVSVTVDEDELMKTARRSCIQEILAKSGLLDQPLPEVESTPSSAGELASAVDSYSLSKNVIEDTYEGSEIVEDSVVS
ncbi:unnamed protein product [Calicophoron daubneyi]|uniref:DNA excision repair protein ERCC-6-like n=1 Tax=Calicophoron daubneyi TaxID=300641 RepID=A0AAV2TPA4_CALDB